MKSEPSRLDGVVGSALVFGEFYVSVGGRDSESQPHGSLTTD